MGLFDQILSLFSGGSKDGNTPLPVALLEMLASNQGGLSGILQKFQSAGLGDVVNSWVGTGQNQPISGGQVHQALGSDFLQQIASRTGLPLDQVSNLVAQHLPTMVDGLTPNGQVEQHGSNDLVALGTSLLKSRFGIG